MSSALLKAARPLIWQGQQQPRPSAEGSLDGLSSLHPVPAELATIRTASGLVLGRHSQVTDSQTATATVVLEEHACGRATGLKGMYCSPLGPFTVPLIDEEQSTFTPPRRVNPREMEIQDAKELSLLEAGIIELTPLDPVKGFRFACNNVVAPKEDVHGVVGNDHYFCHNYRGSTSSSPRTAAACLWQLTCMSA